MISVDTVKACASRYKVSNLGRVVDKETNQEILDETLCMIIKTSMLVYSKAHYLCELTKHQQGGKLHLSATMDEKEYFIGKALDRYGFNGNVNDFRENKMFQSLISGENKQSVLSLSDGLDGTEYEIFEGPNKKYSLAALRYMARNSGKDFENITVDIDLSHQRKDGISEITMETIPKQFKLNQDNLSKEQIDGMDVALKITYLETKANECRIIGDETAANYYNANVERLKKNKGNKPSLESEKVTETVDLVSEEKQVRDIVSEDKREHEINNGSENKKNGNKANLYYDKMISIIKQVGGDLSLDDTKKKNLIGQIFYNEGYLVEGLSTEVEAMELVTRLYDDLNNDDEFGMYIANVVLDDVMKKFPSKNKNQNADMINDDKLGILRGEFSEIMGKYKEMRRDGFDDDVAEYVVGKLTQLYNEGVSLRSYASSKEELMEIDKLLNTIVQNRSQIDTMIYRVRDISDGFSR